MTSIRVAWLPLAVTLGYVALLAFFFAHAEIEIEGSSGWAANLPTWRIEQHWALDLFWGGRALTGYHAWVFSFMALMFHLPAVLLQRWSPRIELRILGALALFWIIEDWLWFVMNPAYGLHRFVPELVPWHKHWFGPAPTDYWMFGLGGLALVITSFGNRRESNRQR